jgi:2-dehydro-3-deoxy-D-arabinonate dehydratase
MFLTRHQTDSGPRWALDGLYLPRAFQLGLLLELPRAAGLALLAAMPRAGQADGTRLAPIEPELEVWAAGVTYTRSREARESESSVADVYAKVYAAERPELFFKAPGWRVIGSGGAVRVRRDSRWNVPEPELVLALNSAMEVVGYCAGDDVSSRDIEGENPLYLPQAKVYDGSCALGPGLVLAGADDLGDLPIRLTIRRDAGPVFEGEARTSQMKRGPGELAQYLGRELAFPRGAFLMTGTCLVPPDSFTLLPGDWVEIEVGELVLATAVEG